MARMMHRAVVVLPHPLSPTNPESTEGRRRVSVLKWRKGAPLNLG